MKSIASGMIALLAATSTVSATPNAPRRLALHSGPAVVREFALTALQHLKGPAQRPFLNLLKSLPPAKQVGVTISGRATKNMSCSGGVCTPTAAVANFNVTQLTNMLVDESVTIGTSAQAPDIFVNAPFGWTSANGLTLQAIGNIGVNKAVSDAGPGPLTVTYNANGAGGTLSFGAKGHISFLSTGNPLTINGQGYVLANNIQTLAQLIARNPAGHFALSASYNAKQDGTYTQSPIQTPFQGNFEGLGNRITNLHVDVCQGHVPAAGCGVPAGLFAQTSPTAILENARLYSVNIDGDIFVGGLVAENQGVINQVSVSGTFSASSTQDNCGAGETYVGEIAGVNDGYIVRSMVSGSITANGNCLVVGGMVGTNGNDGAIGVIYSSASSADVTVQSGVPFFAGGLVGDSGGTGSGISYSSASGAVSGTGKGLGVVGGLVGSTGTGSSIAYSSASGAVSDTPGTDSIEGGLVGDNRAELDNSTATGAVSGPAGCWCGGAMGSSYGAEVFNNDSYGAVTAGAGSNIGGFLGYDYGNGSLSNNGWCTTSSGITDPSQGAGNIPNDPGIAPFTC